MIVEQAEARCRAARCRRRRPSKLLNCRPFVHCSTVARSLLPLAAVGDVLDRSDRPDHLIVEASGIGNPARIANLALAEPELRYSGIVTVVDGVQFPAFANEPRSTSVEACGSTRASWSPWR